jgi:hypothetical protein
MFTSQLKVYVGRKIGGKLEIKEIFEHGKLINFILKFAMNFKVISEKKNFK